MSATELLERLTPGQVIPFGGNRFTTVDHALADAFQPGDRLVVVQDSGALLHIPHADHELVAGVVDSARAAFHLLGEIEDGSITAFYQAFAARLGDDDIAARIAVANDADVASAMARGRSTTRLQLTQKMRTGMIDGLHVWRDAAPSRDAATEVVQHDGWSVTARRAPLGVVGFVFEGRPNVFADATGVLRTGNTAVLRIGSDALGTATAIAEHALRPALADAGLPDGAVALIQSPSRAAGWALFANPGIAMAVARGSGEAVAQLGAVARQSGVPVSLHGTGGGWMVAASSADTARFANAVRHSLDRKVCNTLNVCCIVADRADELVPVFVAALGQAAAARGHNGVLHLHASTLRFGLDGEPIGTSQLGMEWEWEDEPEVTLVVVESVDEAVALFNVHSPRLVASLISDDPDEHDRFYSRCDAPFVGDGFTRWVDGQFALNRPELGLSNWEGGRMLARSAVLSGDSVFTVRLRANVVDHELHR